MNTLWMLPAIACYSLSAVLFATDRMAGRARVAGWALMLLGAGAAFHAMDLAARGLQAGNIPVANFAESLSFLAWVTSLAALILIVRFRMVLIGAYAAPAAAIALGVSFAMTTDRRLVLPAPLQSVWLPIHVSLAIVGYAMFILAASVSLVYLACESRLKAKRPLTGAGDRIPSLEKLDRINYSLLVWGFVMLSAAIVTGAIWADATWGHFWSWEPKESWSLVIWILYAALLESRLTVGWRGRRAAALTIVVFAVLVSSLVGVSLVFPGKHGGTFG